MGRTILNPILAEEPDMRMTATTSQSTNAAGLPRGWMILGLALASWVVVAGLWVGLSQLFSIVSAAI